MSDDEHATLIPVTMAGTLDDADKTIDQVLDRTLHAPHPAGFRVWVAGEATAARDSNTIAEQDLRKGETIGVVAALAILVVVFGTLAAAVASLTLLPALLAVMGDGVNALRVPVLFRRRQADVERTHGFWAGVARRVMARPVTSLVLAG